MNYSIFYPTSIDEIEDANNDNIDVCVSLSNGKSYTIVFVTPDNLKQQMNENDEQFIPPDFRFIIVKSICQSDIEAAIRRIVSEPYYLDFYGSDDEQ